MTKKRLRPRIGDANYKNLIDVSVKLASDEPLDRNDRLWLYRLLAKIQDADDVRELFFKTTNGRPDASERKFWIAVDVRRLRLEMPAERATDMVAERWQIDRDYVRQIWADWKGEAEKLTPSSLLLVEQHRQRLKAEKN